MRTVSFLSITAPLVTCLCLTACGSKEGSGSGSGSAAGGPATVVADDTGVSLGGERLSGPAPDDLKKVDGLFKKLREANEEWKTAHPGEKLAGALTIEFGPAITCRAAMSVFITAAYAGYTAITVKQGTTTVDLPAFIPGPPVPDELLGPPKGPREAFAIFTANGDVALKPDKCLGAFDVVPGASLGPTVKEWCGDKGDCLGNLLLTCDAGMPMSKVLPALESARKGSAKMQVGLAPACKETTAQQMGSFLGMGPVAGADTPEPPKPAPPPAGKRPNIEMRDGEVKTTGPLTPDEAREAVKAKAEDMKACYATALQDNPGITGRVAFDAEIGKKGAVMSVKNGGTDIVVAGMIACLVRTFTTVQFPAKGAVATVRYPMVFSTK